MKWLRELLGRKEKQETPTDERIERCAKNLVRLLRIVPIDDETQVTRLLYVFRDEDILNKTEDMFSFDAYGSGIQRSFLFNTNEINTIYYGYKQAYEQHAFVKFTMEAERVLVSRIIGRLQEYCTVADNNGCDMLLFTGSDIASIWNCLDMVQSFLAYRSITKIDDTHSEVLEFMNKIEGFIHYDNAVVVMNEGIMISDTALDAILYEMTRHYHVLYLNDLTERYPNAEIRYDEDDDEADAGKGGNIRVTEG